jgi:hypothetical protein
LLTVLSSGTSSPHYHSCYSLCSTFPVQMMFPCLPILSPASTLGCALPSQGAGMSPSLLEGLPGAAVLRSDTMLIPERSVGPALLFKSSRKSDVLATKVPETHRTPTSRSWSVDCQTLHTCPFNSQTCSVTGAVILTLQLGKVTRKCQVVPHGHTV